jgi:hypothetical protein
LLFEHLVLGHDVRNQAVPSGELFGNCRELRLSTSEVGLGVVEGVGEGLDNGADAVENGIVVVDARGENGQRGWNRYGWRCGRSGGAAGRRNVGAEGWIVGVVSELVPSKKKLSN